MSVSSKTVLERTVESLYTPAGMQRLVLRPLDLAFKWMKQVEPDLPDPIYQVHDATKEVNQMFGLILAPENIKKRVAGLERSIRKIPKVRTVAGAVDVAAQVVMDGTGLISNANRMLTPLRQMELISLPHPASQALGGIGSIGSLVSGGHGIGKELNAIYNSKIGQLHLSEEERTLEGRKISLSLIRLMSRTLMVAMAILGIAALFSLFYVSAWISLTLSTLALVCALSAYFYEQSCTFEAPQL